MSKAEDLFRNFIRSEHLTVRWEAYLEANQSEQIEEEIKPTPEKYGWHTQIGFDDEPSGWQFEGGEDAYEKALRDWKEKNQPEQEEICDCEWSEEGAHRIKQGDKCVFHGSSKPPQTVEERALELYPIDKPMGEGDKLYSQEVNRGRALQRGAYIKGATDIKTKQC